MKNFPVSAENARVPYVYLLAGEIALRIDAMGKVCQMQYSKLGALGQIPDEIANRTPLLIAAAVLAEDFAKENAIVLDGYQIYFEQDAVTIEV